MKRLDQLLGLYEESAASRVASPGLRSATEEGFRLFGLEMVALSEGAALRRWHSTSPQLGRKRFEEYLPLRFSGILELALLSGAESIAADEIVLLDVETTGLSRGAGTLAFLIGLATIARDGIRVQQLLLLNPAGEEACLDHLVRFLSGYQYLLSFNGKSFDVPVIRNRLLLNRRPELPRLTHFDLLHIFRRLAPRGALPGRRQGDLERELLGVDRGDDIPGAEVPQIYFDWLRYGVDRGMERVLDHNLRDLLGMAFLTLEALRLYAERDSGAAALRSGLARLLLRNRHIEEAIAMLEARRSESATAALRQRDLLLLARLLRSQGRFAEARTVLEMAIHDHDCDLARMALARLLEHNLRDLQSAERITAELLSRAAGVDAIFHNDELERRRQRLARKIARQSA